jgi:hypothetical protein
VKPGEARIPTLFITGAPGNGKTALARELSELLSRVHEPHAVIDLDELTRGALAERSLDFNLTLALENLAAVWTNFYRHGVRRAVLARIILSESDISRLAGAIPGCDMTVCHVVADDVVASRRIRKRDPGLEADFLEEVGPEVTDQLEELDLPGFTVLNNASTSITDLALEVLERAHWPRPHREENGA